MNRCPKSSRISAKTELSKTDFMAAVDDANQPSSVLRSAAILLSAILRSRRSLMGWSWAKGPVVAIALAALAGCCDQGSDQDGAQDDQRLYCNLRPPGVIVTVKGTA